MRTDEEILARIDEVAERYGAFLNFEYSNLISYLPYNLAAPYLSKDATDDDFENYPLNKDKESILKQMKDYMPFAWEKANGCRGLSAMRTMQHYSAWTWLLGDDLGELVEYQYYGKDNLVRICEYYGWDHTQWDDGVRGN